MHCSRKRVRFGRTTAVEDQLTAAGGDRSAHDDPGRYRRDRERSVAQLQAQVRKLRGKTGDREGAAPLRPLQAATTELHVTAHVAAR